MTITEAEVRAWADRRDDMLQRLWRVVPLLPTDYDDYGGQVARWDHPDAIDADCSSGCRFARFLEGSGDWLVCCNPDSPRFGLLTWEHQAGRFCFVPGEAEDDLAEIELDAEHVRAFLGLPDLDVGWRPE
jgi:hypothetical protein